MVSQSRTTNCIDLAKSKILSISFCTSPVKQEIKRIRSSHFTQNNNNILINLTSHKTMYQLDANFYHFLHLWILTYSTRATLFIQQDSFTGIVNYRSFS